MDVKMLKQQTWSNGCHSSSVVDQAWWPTLNTASVVTEWQVLGSLSVYYVYQRSFAPAVTSGLHPRYEEAVDDDDLGPTDCADHWRLHKTRLSWHSYRHKLNISLCKQWTRNLMYSKWNCNLNKTRNESMLYMTPTIRRTEDLCQDSTRLLLSSSLLVLRLSGSCDVLSHLCSCYVCPVCGYVGVCVERWKAQDCW